MPEQDQFLNVIDRDEAERRFRAALQLEPLGEERVALCLALGRVLARDVIATVDVPSFDRSNFDGFAVRATDTFGANEEYPHILQLAEETIWTAVVPQGEVTVGRAATIATGGMVPRGADAVVMIEHADVAGGQVFVRRPVTAGFGVAFAGTDISRGETVFRRGDLLTSRETGVLAAIGMAECFVRRRPKVGVVSTGDEIIPPGEAMRPGLVYDSNARVIEDAVRELGGEPLSLGIVRDNLDELNQKLSQALAECDVVLLSGGTSKGAGDLSYRAVSLLSDPGIVAHGVALKPGKPICLAASGGKPVVILPGFPTSAIFTFHEFVAPVIRMLAGLPVEQGDTVPAQLAVKVNSEIGRTEYLLVGLVERSSPTVSVEASARRDEASGRPSLAAYPMGKGSGSVTTFSQADGFVTIGRHEEIVESGTTVQVRLLGRGLRLADLVVIGSHCLGLDFLLGKLQDRGFRSKFLAVGSTAGLDAARRGECDLAGIHLLDPKSGVYNRPFLSPGLDLVPGYGRLQGVVYREGDSRFVGRSANEAIALVKDDPACLMVNRNQGSGTRILIDQLLAGARPAGYAVQSRSHNAVAASIAQGRADWGVAIRTAIAGLPLGFLPLADEQYDFVVPSARRTRPAVQAFCTFLADDTIRQELRRMGFTIS